MTATNVAEGIDSLEQLYAVLPELNYEPLWTMKGALTPEPATAMVPCLWEYEEVRRLILRAGELISAEDADRRVLAMKNPGTAAHEVARATDTLWAAMQLVMPGEIAPPHRHTAAALRYIVEGVGGYTVVEGRRVPMDVGDFLITPNWTWHEHGHAGEGPMIWLDGLDLPMLSSLRLVFAEFSRNAPPPRAVPSERLASGAFAPTWTAPGDHPTLVWKLADAETIFEELRDTDGTPTDDLILEYRDPATNGPVMETMTAFIQLLRPGVKTQAHQHTSSTVYHVVRGTGTSVIGGRRFDWKPGDTFAVPTWAAHEHASTGAGDAVLFSFSDEPAVRALGLWREQAA